MTELSKTAVKKR